MGSERIAIVGLALAAILVGGFWYVNNQNMMKIDELQKQVNGLTGDKANLQTQVSSLNATKISLTRQVLNLTNLNTELEEEVTSLIYETGNLRDDVATLTNRTNALTAQVSSLTTQKNSLQQQVTTLTTTVNTQSSQITNLTDRVRELDHIVNLEKTSSLEKNRKVNITAGNDNTRYYTTKYAGYIKIEFDSTLPVIFTVGNALSPDTFYARYPLVGADASDTFILPVLPGSTVLEISNPSLTQSTVVTFTITYIY